MFEKQEQEIRTKHLDKKWMESRINDTCRHGGNAREDIQHVLSSCTSFSASLYFPIRHNAVAKALNASILNKFECQSEYNSNIQNKRTRNVVG